MKSKFFRSKIFCCLICIILTISFIGCNSDEFHTLESSSEGIIDKDKIEGALGEDITNQTKPFTEGDHDETTIQIDSNEPFLVTEDGRYVFCAYQNESSSDRKDTYKYKDYQELNLVSSQYSHSYVDETKDKDRTFRFGKDEVNIEYVKSFVSSKENSQLNNKYNNYDVYKDTSGKMYHILADNDQLIKYIDNTNIEQSTVTDIGQDRAVEIANAFVIEHLGEDIFNTYAIKENVPVTFGKYWVSYMKYVYGYATTDEIIICVNIDGSVSSYTGLHVSLYDNISKDVARETIQNAEDQLLNALHTAQLNNLYIVSKEIEIDDNGELCIGLYVTHGNDAQYADVFYLQIAQTE